MTSHHQIAPDGAHTDAAHTDAAPADSAVADGALTLGLFHMAIKTADLDATLAF
jgi:hypothetical protein